MEFAKLLEEKKAKLENLEGKLAKLETELRDIKEKLPPRWSGAVKELNKFVMDLEEWIKSPKLKRAKDLIDKLKSYANDSRSFKGLGEDYLINILEFLEDGVTLLSEIDDRSLKVNASMGILDILQREQDLQDLIQNIRDYWQSFKEFKEKKVQNEFLEVVKEDVLLSLGKSVDFTLEQIIEGKDALEKASNAFKLLIDSGVSIQVYIKTYEISKSVDKIWEEADNIRRLLADTNFQIVGEVEEPFGEMKNILNSREEYIKKETLTEISSGLDKIKGEIEKWREDIQKKFGDEYRKTEALAEFAKLEDGIENLSEEFRRKVRESHDVNDIYSPYNKLQKIKHEATKRLEEQFSENERKIIESLETVDELIESMGNSFWVALKSLREKQLIKITIKKGA